MAPYPGAVSCWKPVCKSPPWPRASPSAKQQQTLLVLSYGAAGLEAETPSRRSAFTFWDAQWMVTEQLEQFGLVSDV